MMSSLPAEFDWKEVPGQKDERKRFNDDNL